jgi:hypothetical protein
MVSHNIVVQHVNPLDDPKWNETIARFSDASFFHSAAWARVLRDAYGYRPTYFVAKDDHGAITCVVPLMEVNSWLTGRRGLSLPFTDECAPLGSDPESLHRTLDAVSARAIERRWKYWELRGGVAELKTPASLAFHGHRLTLSADPARLFAGCSSAARWAIRKAQQTQLKITFENDLEATKDFHALVCKTRKRQGLPPQPWHFFAAIHRHVFASGQGCVVLARLGGVPVAGAVFVHFGRAAIFKFGASDAAFNQLCPNNLVMWRAIEWHARAGFSSLDFGRTSLGHEGLRHFKLGWGVAERRIEYARFDCRASAFVTTRDHASGWHTRFFKILPSAFGRLLGAAAYKHIA